MFESFMYDNCKLDFIQPKIDGKITRVNYIKLIKS